MFFKVSYSNQRCTGGRGERGKTVRIRWGIASWMKSCCPLLPWEVVQSTRQRNGLSWLVGTVGVTGDFAGMLAVLFLGHWSEQELIDGGGRRDQMDPILLPQDVRMKTARPVLGEAHIRQGKQRRERQVVPVGCDGFANGRYSEGSAGPSVCPAE